MSRRLAGIAAAALPCSLALLGCASTRGSRPALRPAPEGGPLALEDAQRRAPFVVYLPAALPEAAGQPRLFFAPELTSANSYAPPRIYVNYPNGLALWQLPRRGRSLEHGAISARVGDRPGWAWNGPRLSETTIEWVQGDTQMGLTGALEPRQLLKIAGSAVQAAPQAVMAAPSQALQSGWGPREPPGATGDMGVLLSPDMAAVISWVAPDSPAARAGVRAHDRLVAVGDQAASELSLPLLAHALRGDPGTQVSLTYIRGPAAARQVTITRRVTPAYRLRDVTLAEARRRAGFRLLTPQHLPRGYRLLSVALVTRDDAPFEVRQTYSSAGRPLLTVAQRARGAFIVEGRVTVTAVGSATGKVAVEGDDVTVAWAQAGTQVRLRLRGFDPAVALAVARALD